MGQFTEGGAPTIHSRERQIKERKRWSDKHRMIDHAELESSGGGVVCNDTYIQVCVCDVSVCGCPD